MRMGKASKSQNLRLGVAALLLESHVQPEASVHVCVLLLLAVLLDSFVCTVFGWEKSRGS